MDELKLNNNSSNNQLDSSTVSNSEFITKKPEPSPNDNYFKINKKYFFWGGILLAVIALFFVFSNIPVRNQVLSFLKISTPEQIARKSVDYLNNNILQQGVQAEYISSERISGVIKFRIRITTSAGSNEYDSYATRDGKLLFPEAFKMNGKEQTSNQDVNVQNSVQITPENVTKVAKTALDVYVVSRCPYGLQVQRAIAKAIEAIPALKDYITIRYIGTVSGNTITAMHGEVEAQENLRQICIREEQPAKYWPYIACQMKNGDISECQSSVGINSVTLKACMSDVKRGVAYASKDFDLQNKYNVQGSPTFILNGQVISETPFGGRSADSMRNIICSSSETLPPFCSIKLDTNQAATSFSLTYTNSSGPAASSNSSNCSPAM